MSAVIDSPGAALVREANRASMLLDPPPHRRPLAPSQERQAQVAEIDPQEFGRLQAQVEQLIRSNAVLTEAVTGLNVVIQSMQLQMAEAKGGWKTLMILGGASASLGGLVTGVLSHFMGKGG
jgi:hypothetical protein